MLFCFLYRRRERKLQYMAVAIRAFRKEFHFFSTLLKGLKGFTLAEAVFIFSNEHGEMWSPDVSCLIFCSPWLSLGQDHPQSQQYGRGPILEPAAVILHQKFRWNKQKWWQWQNDKIDDGSVSPGQEGQHYQGSHRQADTWSQEVQLWTFYILW